jgi:hypothetical protein
VKHPLLLVAVCVTSAVAALSGTAVAAFAAPAASQSTTVRGVAALTVPLNYRPAEFAGSLLSERAAGGNIVVVAPPGARTLDSSKAADGSVSYKASATPDSNPAQSPALRVPPGPGVPAGTAPGQAPIALPGGPVPAPIVVPSSPIVVPSSPIVVPSSPIVVPSVGSLTNSGPGNWVIP